MRCFMVYKVSFSSLASLEAQKNHTLVSWDNVLC